MFVLDCKAQSLCRGLSNRLVQNPVPVELIRYSKFGNEAAPVTTQLQGLALKFETASR